MVRNPTTPVPAPPKMESKTAALLSGTQPGHASPSSLATGSNSVSATAAPKTPPSSSAPISAQYREALSTASEEQDKRIAEARRSLADLRKKCQGVQETVSDVMATNQKTKSASEELDDKWEAFKRKFDEMNKQMISSLGAALGHDPLVSAARQQQEDEDAGGHLVTNLTAEEREKVFEGDISLKTLCRKIRCGEWRNLCVMMGAGISVSAGIPDFRSKGGLYEKFEKEYGMTNPQSVFDIAYFKEHPEVFCARGREMCPGKFKPTRTHHFLRLLELKGLVRRFYTQNIDTLEKQAGIADEAVVYAHGSFADCHCIECGAQVRLGDWRDAIEKDEIPRCARDLFSLEAEKERCGGLVKPDIVFFGEDLPQRFADLRKPDFESCDCLLVLGTSLKVSPFNTLVQLPKEHVPRVLINNEAVGTAKEMWGGFRFGHAENYRDLFLEGACDETVEEMVKELGWEQELEVLMRSARNQDGWKLVSELQPKGEGRQGGLKY